jgi:hypothetical protein
VEFLNLYAAQIKKKLDPRMEQKKDAKYDPCMFPVVGKRKVTSQFILFGFSVCATQLGFT